MAASKEKKAPKAKATKKTASSKPTTESGEFKCKTFPNYTIKKKRSGRYEVLAKNGKNINGLDKAKILVEHKLVKTGLAKAKATEESAPPAAPAAS